MPVSARMASRKTPPATLGLIWLARAALLLTTSVRASVSAVISTPCGVSGVTMRSEPKTVWYSFCTPARASRRIGQDDAGAGSNIDTEECSCRRRSVDGGGAVDGVDLSNKAEGVLLGGQPDLLHGGDALDAQDGVLQVGLPEGVVGRADPDQAEVRQPDASLQDAFAELCQAGGDAGGGDGVSMPVSMKFELAAGVDEQVVI